MTKSSYIHRLYNNRNRTGELRSYLHIFVLIDNWKCPREEQTANHSIFQCKTSRNQRNEMIKHEQHLWQLAYNEWHTRKRLQPNQEHLQRLRHSRTDSMALSLFKEKATQHSTQKWDQCFPTAGLQDKSQRASKLGKLHGARQQTPSTWRWFLASALEHSSHGWKRCL